MPKVIGRSDGGRRFEAGEEQFASFYYLGISCIPILSGSVLRAIELNHQAPGILLDCMPVAVLVEITSHSRTETRICGSVH